jgi:hypothetical protein
MRRLLKVVSTIGMVLVCGISHAAPFYTITAPDTVNLLQFRAMPLGSTVTFQGVVTRAMGAFTRVEDGSAGITIRQTSGAFFDAVQNGTIKEGVLIWITGTSSSYMQQFQIDQIDSTTYNLASFTVYGQYPGQWIPIDITESDFLTNAEAYEGRLVRMKSLYLYNTGDATFKPEKTYFAYQNGDLGRPAIEIRIQNADDTEMEEVTFPTTAFTMIGIVGQFHVSNPAAGYQLMPVFATDLIPDATQPLESREVLFQVNMNEVARKGWFDPEKDSVWVRGDFNGWDLRNLLIDADMDGIYSAGIEIEGPSTAESQYKFYASSPELGWETNVGPAGEYGNRIFSLGAAGSLQELPVVSFNNTLPVVDEVRNVTFVLNTYFAYHSGLFQPGAGDCIVLNGDFNRWGGDPGVPATLQADPYEAYVYKITLPVRGPESLVMQYKYRIISGDGRNLKNNGWEELSEDSSGILNRKFALGEPGQDMTLEQVFFSNLNYWRGHISLRRVPNNFDVLKPGEVARIQILANNFTGLYGLGLRVRVTPPLKILGLHEQYWSGYPDLGSYGLTYERISADSTWIDLSKTQSNGVPTGLQTWFFAEIDVVATDSLRYFDRYFALMTDILAVNHQGNQLSDFTFDPMFAFRSLGPEVWPGDTDTDGFVTTSDVLPIGQFYDQSGPMRGEQFDISWRAHEAPVWMEPMAAHADATGDGRVNQNDLLPIGVNYNKRRINDTLPVPKGNERAAVASLTVLKPGDRVLLDITPDLRGHPELRMLGAAFQLKIPAGLRFTSSEEAPWFVHPDMIRFHSFNPEKGALGIASSRRAGDGEVVPGGAVMRIVFTAEKDLEPAAITLQDGLLSTETSLMRLIPFTLTATVESQTAIGQDGKFVFFLEQNYPNPFNPLTQITYSLESASSIQLTVFNQIGQQVAVLAQGRQTAGVHTVPFDASKLSSGLYFYTLTSGGHTATRKMTLIK